MQGPTRWLAWGQRHWSRAILAMILVAAIGAPWLAPFDPARQLDVVGLRNATPSHVHLLGTDAYARDVLSRALFGARTSLVVAGGATIIALLSSLVWVGVLRLAPQTVAASLTLVTDALRALPRKLLVLAILVPLPQPSMATLAIVLGLTSWTALAPLLQTELARAEAEPFVEAAMSTGMPRRRILTVHMIPQLSGPILTTAALLLADLIAAEAALAFLGLGVRVPTSSWGGMLLDAVPYLNSAWWVAAVPITLIAVTVGSLARAVTPRGLRHEVQ